MDSCQKCRQRPPSGSDPENCHARMIRVEALEAVASAARDVVRDNDFWNHETCPNPPDGDLPCPLCQALRALDNGGSWCLVCENDALKIERESLRATLDEEYRIRCVCVFVPDNETTALQTFPGTDEAQECAWHKALRAERGAANRLIAAALSHPGLAGASHRMTVGNETRYLECREGEPWKCDETCWACLRVALGGKP